MLHITDLQGGEGKDCLVYTVRGHGAYSMRSFFLTIIIIFFFFQPSLIFKILG